MAATAVKEYTYKSSWNVVIMAYQERFRSVPHPKIPSLAKVEFKDFETRDEKKEVSWVTRGTIIPPVPTWVLTFFGVGDVVFKTTNVVNYEAKTLTVSVVNETLWGAMNIVETNIFRVHPENPEWTLYTQNSELKILKWIFGMEGTVQEFIMNAYMKGYETGRQVDEEFVQLLLSKPELPRFGYLEEMTREFRTLSPASPSLTSSSSTAGVEVTASDVAASAVLTLTSEAVSSSEVSESLTGTAVVEAGVSA